MKDIAVSIDGKVVPPEQATVSVFDHGFLFGDSVYEVVRTYDNRWFQVDEHLTRLRVSGNGIHLDVRYSNNEFMETIQATHEAWQGSGEAMARIIVTRGEGAVELSPKTCHSPHLIVMVQAVPEYPESFYTDGVDLAIVKTRRVSRRALDPAKKTGNYLNNVLALVEAHTGEAHDGVMCNPEGDLTECTTSNLFLVKDGVILTPSMGSGILPGITRSDVITMARGLDLNIKETTLKPVALFEADEVFITSTTRGIMPVRKIDATEVGTERPGPITSKLMMAFEGLAKTFA